MRIVSQFGDERKIPQDKHERDRFVVHRHDDGQFQAPPQLGDERTPAPL